MKKTAIFLISFLMLFAVACNNTPQGGGGDLNNTEVTEITLWSYPVGGWEDTTTISSLLASFHNENPDIRVSLKAVDYNNGDGEVEKAIANNTLPDLIFEGPERLVANWGARGLMVDISDLWQEKEADEILEVVEHACHDPQNRYYIFPLCMTTHCMAINYDLFKKADALKYINEETHTWKSTDDFFNAIDAIGKYADENKEEYSNFECAAKIYCGGQGGDQGTRALVNNLYGGAFCNTAHTEYTVDSQENKTALERLREESSKTPNGIKFDSTIVGADEITQFCEQKLAMAFCWNVNMEVNNVNEINFEVFPMAFPADDDKISLQGGIWGFGIFDNGDEKKIEASKKLIRYFTADEEVASRAVKISRYWPVKDIPDFYENEPLMIEYGIFRKYFGDYYQITTNWAKAREAWWNLLQKVGSGEDIDEALKEFTKSVKTQD